MFSLPKYVHATKQQRLHEITLVLLILASLMRAWLVFYAKPITPIVILWLLPFSSHLIIIFFPFSPLKTRKIPYKVISSRPPNGCAYALCAHATHYRNFKYTTNDDMKSMCLSSPYLYPLILSPLDLYMYTPTCTIY